MRISFDQLFWHPSEPRIDRRRTGWWIKLWRIRPPSPGFERDVVRVLRLDF